VFGLNNRSSSRWTELSITWIHVRLHAGR
jgi:hypothetical protein